MVTFGQAAEILERVGQIPISYSSVWRRVEQWGTRFQGMEAYQMAKANGLAGPVEQDANKSKDRMGVAMDGGMIHIREEGWKELKVGCVFDIEMGLMPDALTREKLELARAVNNTYVAHLGGPQHFGKQVWTEARQRGWVYAEDSVVIGDGATWIWNLASEHFYDSHQLVDWYHGTQHLASAAQLLHGEGTPQAQRWYKNWQETLYQGHADRVAQALQGAAKERPKFAEELRQEAGYFRNNQLRMNYLQLRSDGYPIGSGMVESAAKQYKARFSGSGMRWSRPGAERLLPVRTAILSGRFDQMWHLSYNSPPN